MEKKMEITIMLYLKWLATLELYGVRLDRNIGA